jgi:hypothetical protein
MIDVAMGTFSLILFLVLPREFHWKSFMIIGAMLGYSIYRRLSMPKDRKFSFQTIVGWSVLYTLGTFAAISCLFFRLTEDKKVAKVILTGNGHSEWISWKNPSNQREEGAWLQCHEVIVENLKGKELFRQHLYGDLVGLRAEVITVQWPFYLLGFSHLCHLESLYNGYRTAHRHNLLPHLASALPFPLPALQALWEKLYQGEWRIPGIKNVSLESTYLPLMTMDLKPHEATYWLVVGETGLTSIKD